MNLARHHTPIPLWPINIETMRYIFSILLLLSITLSNAQSLKGKYISTFERHVWIKYLGAAPEKGKYHLRNNKLKIKTENDKIHGKYISNDSLVIIINDGKSLVQLI